MTKRNSQNIPKKHKTITLDYLIETLPLEIKDNILNLYQSYDEDIKVEKSDLYQNYCITNGSMNAFINFYTNNYNGGVVKFITNKKVTVSFTIIPNTDRFGGYLIRCDEIFYLNWLMNNMHNIFKLKWN